MAAITVLMEPFFHVHHIICLPCGGGCQATASQRRVQGPGAGPMPRRGCFVGENSFRAQVVHYISPDEVMVADMLTALKAYETKTRGANPVARAAAVSFAFVYLHPLADGNGRVHRFLINHLLTADNAVPINLIVPVSATIAGSARGRADYDAALEQFSKPFMRLYADAYRFGPRRTAKMVWRPILSFCKFKMPSMRGAIRT